MPHPSRIVLFVSSLLGCAATHADIEVDTLDNGLTVVIEPTSSGERAAIVLAFDVGERHDPVARAGMAHLTEHCFVTAAAGTQPVETADAWFARYGGQANAQTGRDYTAYAMVVDATSVPGELERLAERWRALRITEDDLVRERPRVAEELANMYGRIPALGVSNIGQNLADPLPHGHPKGGDPKMLRDVAATTVQAWFDDHYRPGNAILSIAGRFDRTAAMQTITDGFGPLAAGLAPDPPATDAAPPAPPVDVVIERRGDLLGTRVPVAGRTYRMPDPDSPHYAASLAFANRLFQVSQLMHRGGRPIVPPVNFAPLDNPRVLSIGAAIEVDGDHRADAIAALDAIVARATDTPLQGGEGRTALMNLGMMLGAHPAPPMITARNPYLAALRNARTRQLGIDGARLRTALESLTDERYQAFIAWLDTTRRADVVIAPE